MFAIFPEILNQTLAGDVEALSCLVRKYFADGQVFAPNLRVSDICANAEIKIRSDAKTAAARLEAWDANGQFRIEISLHPDIRNQRELNYILATLLGHVFLDLQPKMAKGELQRSIFEKRQSPLRELLLAPESASDVDQFATSLLLPMAMVKKAMATLASRKDVAAFFNVDLQLLDFRLAKLGLVTGAKAEAPKPETPRAEPKPPVATEAKAAPRRASEEPAKPKSNPNPDPSSLARVNRNTAARSYKKEGESEAKTKPQAGSPGLERLRQLARKIDKSVSD